jgi:hypothetical protein
VRRLVIAVFVVVATVFGILLASAASDEPSRTYRNAVVVDAPRAAIWSLLTEFDRYDEWNPYITGGSGDATAGSILDLRFRGGTDDEGKMRTAKVLIVRPMRKLEWRTRVFAPGLLDREQVFRVLPRADGRWDVVQEVRFEGVLVPFTGFDEDRRGLVEMLDALAERAPSYQSSSP